MTSNDYLEELVSGLVDPPPFEESMPTNLPVREAELEWMLWIGLAAALLGLMWMLAQFIFEQGQKNQWPALRTYFKTNANLEMARIEFRTLEILTGVFDENTRYSNAEWALLTNVETQVALATLHGKSVDQIATELSCTKSHVYNIRAAIRKKWGLDSADSFKVAIEDRYHT